MANETKLELADRSLAQLRLGFIGLNRPLLRLAEWWLQCGQAFALNAVVLIPPAELPLPEGWQTVRHLDEVFRQSEVIFIGLSMRQLLPLLPRVRLLVSDRHWLMLAARDTTFEALTQHINERKMVRLCLGISSQIPDISLLLCPSALLSPAEQRLLLSMFEGVGQVLLREDERDFEAIGGVMRLSPALISMMMESLFQVTQSLGLEQQENLKLVAGLFQALGRECLEAGLLPSTLKQQVLEENAPELQSLIRLEQSGFRGHLMRAVADAAQPPPSETED